MKFRAHFLLMLTLFIFPMVGFSQRIPLPKWEVRVGTGMRPTFSQDKPEVAIPPLMAELRTKINPHFSLGVLAGHTVSHVSRPKLGAPHFVNNYRNEFSVIALRAAAHSSPRPKWGAYGGMTLGYGINKMILTGTTDNTLDPRSSTVAARGATAGNKAFVSAYIGSSYRIGRRWGLYGELGFGISVLTAGLSYQW